jgi:hypothetical protein
VIGKKKKILIPESGCVCVDENECFAYCHVCVCSMNNKTCKKNTNICTYNKCKCKKIHDCICYKNIKNCMSNAHLLVL